MAFLRLTGLLGATRMVLWALDKEGVDKVERSNKN